MAPAALGRCRVALLFAVLMDVVGVASLLVGIFAQLQVNGRDFGDLLIYTGAILVFLSLVGWIFWYTGNIEISLEELERDYAVKGGTLAHLARKISRRLSRKSAKPPAEGRKKGGPYRGGGAALVEKADGLQLPRIKGPKEEPPPTGSQA
ncbi:transmembrane protein 238 [Ambystoma mexicanum]|uniref:transmembrane protein 238 n=1 Tax=Ambystoma mexicanum TaxID=8296 RepID=UPI0037E825B6